MIKKSFKIGRMVSNILFLLLPFVIAYFILKSNNRIEDVAVLSDEFVMNFIGAVLGLGITIITFVYSSVDKLRAELNKRDTSQIHESQIEGNIKRIFNILKQDMFAIFVFFICTFVIAIIKDCDIPHITWGFYNISKPEFIYFIKIYLMLLTFISIFDIMTTLFKLLQANELFTDK